MPVFNYPKKEVNVKVVYYGPGLSGKTTNLQKIHEGIKPEHRGKLVSLATQTDRTLFFDFMPLELGSLGGYKVRLHLYTVPGQVHYNATRKLVLKGVDGIVFVADSQRAMNDANVESFLNLEKNLQSYGKSLADLPHIIQANKRDLGDVITLEEINSMLNHHQVVVTEAVASAGTGVLETLTEIVRVVMQEFRDHFAVSTEEVPEPSTRPAHETGREEAHSSPPANGTESGRVDDSSPEDGIEAGGTEPAPVEDNGDDVAGEPAPVEARQVESGSPVKVLVPVEGIGTMELLISISARVLEHEETGGVKVQVTSASQTGAEHLRSAGSEPPNGPDSSSDGASHTSTRSDEANRTERSAGDVTGDEPDPLTELEVHERPRSVEKDLPSLEEASEEPLGAPLDGEVSDDLQATALSKEKVVLQAEDLDAGQQTSPLTEKASEYDPSVQPMDFDFPERGESDERSRKKGLLGRFGKKK
jgi:signal recognition particle receptor subunit beta